MAAAYKRNRQEVSGRLASQSQLTGGSQPNLTGTISRTQVERRPTQFISASRNRLDSDSVLEDRSSPTSGTSSLKRTAKSQERLNSPSNSLNDSRANIIPPSTKSRAYVDPIGPSSGSRNTAQSHLGGGPNYSNISNYSNTYSDRDIRSNRDPHSDSSNIHSSTNLAINRAPASDSSFYEFEKVRLDYLRRGKLYEDTVFLPNDASIYFSRNPPFRIDWLRARVSLT